MWSWFRSRRSLHAYTGSALGTTYTVKAVAAGRSRDDQAMHEEIDSVLNRINQAMSIYLPDSEVSRFNRHESDAPFRLSDETFRVFQRALQVSTDSGGAFDITVRPVVDAYGFGDKPFPAAFPTDAELEKLRECVGFGMLELDSDAKTVRTVRPDLQCDLSGVAKGYAVDCIAALLEKAGCSDCMVEVGGEVRVHGRSDRDEAWRVAIDRPLIEGRAAHRVLALTDCAVATSGDYRVYYVRDGRHVSHTIDPRTCTPLSHDTASATVVCEDCATADAWATAMLVLGHEDGAVLAERINLAVLFLRRRENTAVEEHMTSAFRAMV